MSTPNKEAVVTRVFINEDGNIIVSDLWEEIYQELVVEESGGTLVIKD